MAAAVMAYAKANSPQAAKALLAQYSYTKVSDIPPENRAGMVPLFAVAV